MLAGFRQVRASLLERAVVDPGLVEAIIDYRIGPATGMSDVEAVLAQLPKDMRDGIQQMPAELRVQFVAEYTKALSELPEEIRNGVVRHARGPATRPAIEPADVGEELDLEKAWHGVHFLLCGTNDTAPAPLGDAVLGGTPIGEDIGYGPARYLDPPRVKAVHTALRRIDGGAFIGRFDAAKLKQAEIYPSGWTSDDRRAWLADAYERLRTFYAQSASGGWAVLLYLQ